MLISSSTISENIIHVWKPLADQMSRRVLQDLGILQYMENHIYVDSSYTGPSKSWRDIQSRHAILNEPGMYVNVKFNATPLGLKWDVTNPGQHMDPAIHRRDTMVENPLFYDPKTGVHIIEREQPCMMELECGLCFTDRVLAFDAVTRLMSTYVRGGLFSVTDLKYDYKFPLQLLTDLYTIGRMSGTPKGQVLDWIKRCSHGKMDLITNIHNPGKHKEMIVHREMYEVLAAIDYNADEPTTQSVGTSADTITLSFNITLQFGRVNMLYLKYPIVINNNLVPESLVYVPKSDAYTRLITLLKHPILAYDGQYQAQKHILRQPVRLPWYDNWMLPDNSRHTFEHAEPFLIGVFTLDNTACDDCADKCKCDCCECKYTVIDLYEDFDPHKLKEPVITYFKEHPQEALYPDAPYNLAVFADNTQVSPDKLQFDGRYLKFPNTMGSHRTYRLVLCKTPEKDVGSNPWFFVLDCIIVVEVGVK